MKNLYTYLPKDNTSHIDGVLSTRLAPAGWEKYKNRSGKLTKEEVLEWLDSLDPGFKRSNAISVLTEPIPDNAHPDILAYRDSHVLRILPNYQKLKRNGLVSAIRRINRGRKGTSETSRPNYRKIDWDKIKPGKFLMSNVPHYLIETTEGKIPPAYVKETATGKLADILAKYQDVKYGYKSGDTIRKPGDNEYFDEYRLKSPEDTLRDKLGICFDVAKGLSEDMRKAGIPAKELYIEADNGNKHYNASHSAAIVDEGPNGAYVIERGWTPQRAILRRKSLRDIVDQYKENLSKSTGSPVNAWIMDKSLPAGISAKEYVRLAKQREIK